MAMGRREAEQRDLFVLAHKLQQSPGMWYTTSSMGCCVKLVLIGMSRRCASRTTPRARGGRRCRRASTFACCSWDTSRGSTHSGASPGGAAIHSR
jgi:hypothetical protein